MWSYLFLLPVILALWAIAGIWIVFAIAVVNRTVDLQKGFPFISNCGSYAPQSCIFGQVLNTGAALAIWICIVRYHQLRDWGVKTWQNQLILWSGLLCALGTSIVGNFQVRCAGSQPGGGWEASLRKPDYNSLCFPWLLAALSVALTRKAFWDL
ncbi:Modulator of macroautophagy TMEM150B [Lemmus lemmus]